MKAKTFGSGWFKQSVRHKNARLYGKAGGTYAKPTYLVKLTTTPKGFIQTTTTKLKPVKNDNAYNKKELAMGVKVEMEHTTDKSLAKIIAKNHLDENPVYYSNLKKAGQLLGRKFNLSYEEKIKLLTPEQKRQLEEYGNKLAQQVRNDLAEAKRKGISLKELRESRKFGFSIPQPPLNSANVLPIQVSTIVPSTEGSKKISGKEFRKRIDETKKTFDKAFGGDTTIQETGSYEMDGTLIKEKGAIVESSTTKDAYLENINKISDFVENKQKDWKQDTMLLRVEGTTLITPKKEYIPSEKTLENKEIEVN